MLLLASLALQFPNASQGLPENFELAPREGTFTLPVALEFAADGSYLLAGKLGQVWFHDGVEPQTTPVIDLADEVNNDGDRGLLGLALHPGWVPDGGATSWIYLSYTVSPVFGEDWGYNEDGRYSFSRLSRYRVETDAQSGDVVAVDASREVLIGEQLPDGSVPDGMASLFQLHGTGSLVFGSDGSLLVAVGDGAHILDAGGLDDAGFDDFVNPLTSLVGPTPKEQDSGAFRAQDLRSLAGKVLRIDPATGHGYPSNPFFDGDATSNASKVWALGLRNPFRMRRLPGSGSGDPATGDPGTFVTGDVGWQTFEELNVVRGGENFGWPCFEGPDAQAWYQEQDTSSSALGLPDCSAFGPGALTPPLLAWNASDPALLSPAVVTFDVDGVATPGVTGRCTVGGVVYEGGPYPNAYDGRVFFADFSERWIKTLTLDGDGDAVEVRDLGSTSERAVDVARDPTSGDIHFVVIDLASSEGRVLQLRYDPNGTPSAAVAAAPVDGGVPLAVQFDGTASFDPDEDPLDYEWDFKDGTPLSTDPAPMHTFTTAGTYEVTLTVTDPAGRFARATVLIGVGNTFPAGRAREPALLVGGRDARARAPDRVGQRRGGRRALRRVDRRPVPRRHREPVGVRLVGGR